MTAPAPLPTYVYKILDAPPAEPLPSELPVSELDANDGFVHLSTAAQVFRNRPPSFPPLSWKRKLKELKVPNTASLFFDAHPSLWILKVALGRLGDTRWEGADGQGRAFPHFYGKLGAAHVEGARELARPADGWGALGEAWLE